MPNRIVRQSAVKSHRKSEEARLKHKSRRNALATTEKKLRAAVAAKDQKVASELLVSLQSALDKGVKIGTLHKNKAARKKSRITALIATIGTEPAAKA